jgi:hypothetical protein
MWSWGMERQTLDQEGARFGEVSALSLQMGDDTIAIQRIATMTVEAHKFKPWDTPRNRSTQGLIATLALAALFFGLAGAAWWKLATAHPLPFLLIGGFLILVSLALGIQAILMAAKINREEPYYRLVIGTSDGRKVPLVDNSREILTKIRDVLRHKMDTGDKSVTGEFDLNTDQFTFSPIKVDVGAKPPADV